MQPPDIPQGIFIAEETRAITLWVQQAAATAAPVINVLVSGHLAELYNHNSHQAYSWH